MGSWIRTKFKGWIHAHIKKRIHNTGIHGETKLTTTKQANQRFMYLLSSGGSDAA
jgi:hypothetical protein